MFNEAQVSLTGYVATDPLYRVSSTGIEMLRMRVGWTPRKRDQVNGDWIDAPTSFVTVLCWRKLATNLSMCLRKGDPVVVKGRLSVREFERQGGGRGVAVEVDAAAVGHDLERGVARFARVRPQTGQTAAEAAANGAELPDPGYDPVDDLPPEVFDEAAISELADAPELAEDDAGSDSSL